MAFAGAIMLLFWNEGRAAKRYEALKEGAGSVVEADADNPQSGNEGKLVHLTGMPAVDSDIGDPLLKTKFKALGIIRNVEMYQWREITKTEEKINAGGSKDTVTVYSYEKTWSKSPIPSKNFKEPGHDNPQSLPVAGGAAYAKNVSLGKYVLPDKAVRNLGQARALSGGEIELEEEAAGRFVKDGDALYLGAGGGTNANPAAPSIGDARISFQIREICPVSVAGRQAMGRIVPYIAKNKSEILLASNGILPPDELFSQARSANKFLTNLLRIAAFFVMMCGLRAVLDPLKVLSDVVPFLGRILSAGIGLLSFAGALAVSLVTVAVAWFFFRPVLSAILIAVAAGAIFFAAKLKRGKS